MGKEVVKNANSDYDKKFTEAKELIRKHGKNRQGNEPYLNPQILIKQAEFERDSGNWKEAADLYV